MKRFLFFSVALLLVLTLRNACFGQSFSKAMPVLFGKEYEGFQWLDYPLGNYGVWTMYGEVNKRSGPGNKQVKLKNVELICDTFQCAGINPIPPEPTGDAVRPEDDPWFRIAPVGSDINREAKAAVGCGAEINDIKELKRKSKVAISALLPLMLKTVGLDAQVGYDKSVTLNGKLGIGCRRSAYAEKLEAFFRSLPPGSKTRSALDSGQLIVTVYDAVIKSIDLTVAPNSELGVKLNATLQGKAAETFGKDAKVGVEVSKGTSGEYKLKLTKPLIVGFLARQQPRGAGVAGSRFKFDVNRWQRAAITLPAELSR